jgi:hypothetical protein
MGGRKPSNTICTTEEVLISRACLDVLHSVAFRNTTTIDGIKGTRLLKALLLLKLLIILSVMLLLVIKLLSIVVVIFHIKIYKGMKRRSWRKTSLLLQMPHVLVLLDLAIAEVRHEPLKRMASGVHGTMTMAMTTATPTSIPMPTPSRGSS